MLFHSYFISCLFNSFCCCRAQRGSNTNVGDVVFVAPVLNSLSVFVPLWRCVAEFKSRLKNDVTSMLVHNGCSALSITRSLLRVHSGSSSTRPVPEPCRLPLRGITTELVEFWNLVAWAAHRFEHGRSGSSSKQWLLSFVDCHRDELLRNSRSFEI